MAGGGVAARRRLAVAPHAVAHAPALELGAPGRRWRPRPCPRRGLLRASRRARPRAGVARGGMEEPRCRAGARWLEHRGADRRPRRGQRIGALTHQAVRRHARGASRRAVGGGVGGMRGTPRRRRARPRGAGAHRAAHRLCRGRRLHGRRPGRLRARLGGAVLHGHGGERTPPRHRAHRGARADGLGRPAWRAADLPTGAERQRPRARAVRERRLQALPRLSLPRWPRGRV